MLPVVLGFLIDLMLGDPHGVWHPVCVIGSCISKTEAFLRGRLPKTKGGELLGGILLLVFVSSLSFLVPAVLLVFARRLGNGFALLLETVMCYQIFAVKSLKTESMRVYKALGKDDIEGGRKAVSMIVGRDTKNLTKEGIIKAAVETVAENTADGVIAPMLFMMLGGAPLGFWYKAVNTLDSMTGYRNTAYEYFGRASARMDDILNFIPSRISGLLFIASAFLTGQDGKGAWRIFRRDRHKHASPNSAQTESAAAGALGIALAGDAWYFGELHKKETIGEPLRPVRTEDIRLVNRMMVTASWLGLILFGMIRIVSIIMIKEL